YERYHSRNADDGVYLVHCVSFFDDVPRSVARAGGKNRRRYYGGAGWPGQLESYSAYPALSVWDGGFSDFEFLSFRRRNDRMGQRALRSAVGAAASAALRLDGAGGTRGEFYADAAGGCGASGSNLFSAFPSRSGDRRAEPGGDRLAGGIFSESAARYF